MRLVCRRFSGLDQLHELRLLWQTSTPEAASSLALFFMRHCSTSKAPGLHITIKIIPVNARPVQAWPSLTLALSCSSLRHLHCATWHLELHQAQVVLRLVPLQLQSLGLCTAASIVDDPKWQRLSALTCLHHESVGHMEGLSLAGSGIEAFPH